MAARLAFLLVNVLLLVQLNQSKAAFETQEDILKYVEIKFTEVYRKDALNLLKSGVTTEEDLENFISELGEKYQERFDGEYKIFSSSPVWKALRTEMEKCPAGHVFWDKYEKFVLASNSLDRKFYMSVKEDISKDAAQIPDLDVRKDFIDSKVQQLKADVEEFSNFILTLFGDSFQQMTKECVNDDVIDDILQSAHAEMKTLGEEND